LLLVKAKQDKEESMGTHAVKENLPVSASEESFMSVREAAAFLSIPEMTIYKWCLAGFLPSFKVSKLRRLKKSDLLSFMESHRVHARAAR